MKKPSPDPIHSLLAARWSPRAFNPGGGPDAAQLPDLANAARWAPSCFGAEPWFFVFCHRPSNPDAWDKAQTCLLPGNQSWAKNAPLLVLVCAETHFAHNGKPNRHHAYDSGAAAFSLVLQAEAMGFRCHQMGGFDPDKARAEFRVPDGCDCVAMIAVGEQLGADALPDDLREREQAPRKRKPLAENFFNGEWGKGLQS